MTVSALIGGPILSPLGGTLYLYTNTISIMSVTAIMMVMVFCVMAQRKQRLAKRAMRKVSAHAFIILDDIR